MDAERWRTVTRIFHEALDLPEEERADHVRRACAGDAELEGEVAGLLDAHRDDDFLETPVAELAALDRPLAAADGVPDRIGGYEVVRALGEGGMGRVFLAMQRTESFERTVAIKLVKRGMDTDEILRRFGLERRILAKLVHPNIAQLHDAGAAEDGRPYFVMEYVEGVRIDRYARDRALGVRDRLRLFRAVCAAVQHAHQSLVLHRDIKPGNVLVTTEGVPKLVDFGVGKVLSEHEDGSGPPTRTRMHMLTPDYAAPEQLLGEPATTATDVYGLGALLYELLTGTRPWTAGMDGRTDHHPTRPSEAAARDNGANASGPVVRARTLRGDLDNIVLRAMHPDPERRYASAAAVSDDVERYLRGLPVRAAPDSVAYRTSKFLRRNAWSTATAAAVALGLVGVTVTTEVQSRRVTRERDKAQEVQSFLLETFGASTAEGAAGDSVTVRQLLDGQLAVVRSAYDTDPELQSDMLAVLADAYQRLGLYDVAEELARETLDRRRSRDPLGPETAFSTNLLGWIRHEQGASDEGAELIAASVEIWRGLGRGREEGLARALNDLGSVYDQLGRSEEAEPLLREALALRRAVTGPLDRSLAITSSNLAALMYRKGEYAAADSLGQLAVDALRASVGPEHRRTFIAQSNLAVFRWVAGDLDGAARVYDDMLEQQTRLGGGRNARTASAMVTYAVLRRARGEPDEAESLLREALSIQDEVLDPFHPDIGNTTRTLGEVLQQRGRLDEALGLQERSLEINRRAYGDGHAQYAESLLGLAITRDARGDAAEALAGYREAWEVFVQARGAEHPLALGSGVRLGVALLEQGRADAAEGVVREVHVAALRGARKDAAIVHESRVWLAEASYALGRHAVADSLLRASEEAGADLPTPLASRVADLRRRVAAGPG